VEVVRSKLQGYRSLVKFQAWEELVELAHEQITVRENQRAGMDVKTQSDVADFNFLKGEIGALKLFVNFPQILIDTAEEDLDEYDKAHKE
jgi:hypothetical protein